MSKLSRRKFLFTAGATAAGTLIIHGCAANNSPSPTPTTTSAPAPAVNINPADAPEIATATLGFIALTDSAPLIIALEKGLFAKYGMSDVKVVKQASWPVT
ncbi:MAG: ABC transporter substrate-binding protein, partial [Planktothrix sp.]